MSIVATRSVVLDSAVEVELLPSNIRRVSASFYNDSTVDLYLGLGSGTVTVANYTVRIPAGGFYELPIVGFSGAFTGRVKGIWASDPDTGGCRITEVTS